MNESLKNNDWFRAYGKRVTTLVNGLEQKRLQNSFEGDVNCKEIIFLINGLLFALNQSQREKDEFQKEKIKLDKIIEELTSKFESLKKDSHEDMITD